MAAYNKKFALWLKETNNPFFEYYQNYFKNGEDIFYLLGQSNEKNDIVPSDLVSALQSELTFDESKAPEKQSNFVALQTPINNNFLGHMVRAADIGAKVETDCPNYKNIISNLAKSYKVKIIDSKDISGVISYKENKFVGFLKKIRYNFILRRAKRAAEKGKDFSVKKLDLHSITNKIYLDNSFMLSNGAYYRIGNNEKLLNVVNAFAKNLTEIFFNHKGAHFISYDIDRKIMSATQLLSTLYVSRAMYYGDIKINEQIEKSLKVQIAQTLSSIKGAESNLALKKIREETIEVTKYMMHRQGLTTQNLIDNSEKMGYKFAEKITNLEQVMFGKLKFKNVLENFKDEDKDIDKEENKNKDKNKDENFDKEDKDKNKDENFDKEDKDKNKDEDKPKEEKSILKIKKMDLIRELSKRIDESVDNTKDEFWAGNTGWYFNAYQSVINKTQNSSYDPVKNLKDLQTNSVIVDTRHKLLESLAQSIVQTSEGQNIEFTDKQLSDLQGEWIAKQMIKVVSEKFGKDLIEIEVPFVKKTKSNLKSYNEMFSNACDKVFEKITGQKMNDWINLTLFVNKNEILTREKNEQKAIIEKIKNEGIVIPEKTL
ncbi:MAG: hypothetical protein WCR30_04880 [Clostridia bacterium]